jgi:PPK2 family polyphosphate:nucleotide phosphotransferase
MAELIDCDRYRVKPGADTRLDHWTTSGKKHTRLRKADAPELLAKANARLAAVQQLLYAEGKHKVLVVLQGMDTSGKDGTIRHVFHTVNPQGVTVASFKRPTDDELAHDYLWRTHQQTPASGHITIFNRSHYEDVLVVRVHDLVPKRTWKRRYGHIADFEQMLVDEGTTIVKFFLHISKDEQRARLQARIDTPEKNWKFETGDLAERELWNDYQAAYATALAKTSTKDAPWYIVPSDHKWLRNLLISQVLIERLEGLGMTYPPPDPSLASTVIV